MAVARVRREFRMELRREEPWMDGRRQLDELDETVAREPREHEPRARELFGVVVVELVAMAVALRDLAGAVDRLRERAVLDVADLRAEAHRAAEIGCLGTFLQRAVAVVPLRDHRDHGVR